MRSKSIFLALAGLSAFPGINGQSVQCVTVADGCSAGAINEDAINDAISRFETGLFYGGGSEPVVFSSALRAGGAALAMISYTCNGGSPPPRLEGSVIRGNFRKILSCPNRCGGVASSTNSNCGFGILVSNNAANTDCFSKAIDHVPQGTTTTTTSRTTTTTTGAATPTINPGTNGFTYYGCYSDDVNARVLSNQYVDANGMTIAACMDRAAGYNFAGVEYGQECWYGNALSGSNGESSGCNMPCPGKANELCGGGNRIQLYKNPSYQPPNTPNLGAFTSGGCYTDSVESRGLDHTTTDAAMTIQKCLQFAAGFKYAAVQYHNECFWGNELKSSSVPAASEDCNAPCAGDSSQMCGGGNRLSLYINGAYQGPQEPQEPDLPSINQGNEDWELLGCKTDSASSRALENSEVDSSMTVAKCLELAFSYKYAAVQGGNTCYWGDELGSSSQNADADQCNTACGGNSGESCGGSLKNVVYTSTDFEEIDVPAMIELMEDLYHTEQEMIAELQEYESQRLQAEAEGEQEGGGNKRKRFIPAIWAARLAATWVRVRARTDRALRVNIRFRARMQGAWRRLGPYLQRFLVNRPQAPQQFEMQALIPAQRHAVVVAQRGGEIMAIQAARAAQGILVAVELGTAIGRAIADIVDVITWHQDLDRYGPVQPTDPDPPDNPDPPEDDPQDPENLEPCPCGIGGCINPGLKLARSAPMKPRVLEKRRSGEYYTLERCTSLSYKVRNYPTSSELRDIYQQVNLPPPYYDLRYFTPPGAILCSWMIHDAGAPQPLTPGTQNPLANYQTEHVFENNLMKGFFDEMVRVGCAPCAADATGPGLREMFFNRITTQPNSRYNPQSFTLYMVDRMSWYMDTHRNQGYLEDFVTLEERINKNKYQILFGVTVPDQWGDGLHGNLQRYIELIARVQAVFQYMNEARISSTFVDTFNRVLGEFDAFGADQAYGANHPPRSPPGSTCAAAASIPQGSPDSWSFRFHNYIASVLVDVERKMGQWAINTVFNMQLRSDALWPPQPPPAPVPIQKQQFDAWVATQSAVGGLLHPGSYKFDRIAYATFGLT
ncbi:hypothetical protein TWF730_011259 [Orbilia blumenaviensis]|uniref:WSC domain-containing protein n=1 Tax=Orbilia blumenaviensis TaxID=1796055 RepID=A0AAV9UKL3_9PEZI